MAAVYSALSGASQEAGFIGIDPGVTGAIAFLRGERALVFDPPCILVPVGAKRRAQMIESAAADLIRSVTGVGLVSDPGRWRAGIEWAQAMPILRPRKDEKPCPTCGRSGDPEGLARQGAVSAFSYGQGFGTWLGILATLKIPFVKIRPQNWKRMVLAGYASKDKDAARAVASSKFPGVDLGRRKDAGRAEALLIAECTRLIERG